MTKYKMLGVNRNGKCCIISCLLPFSSIHGQQVEASDFHHDSTNWCGCDDIERTLDIIHATETGNVMKLRKPMKFCGSDEDMGHSYSWAFDVTEIREISY